MTHFSWPIDGTIVGLYLLATMIAGIMVRKYVGKVEHFLVAGREMNIYLGIASLAATEFGIVTCMYTAQNAYKYGFAGAIPGLTNVVAMFLVGYTGFGVKPLRDAGVMTIPELYERRYGKFVRWLSGVVIVLGGLLNMGVFLRMGGQFLVVCCGLNLKYLEVTMTVLLIAVAFYTILGGMLSVLVTDYLQFVVMSVGLIAVTVLVLVKTGWTNAVFTVDTHYGAGGFNPFVNPDLGWQFVLSNTFTSLAAVLTWQPVIARVLAAKDSATGRKIYTRTSFFFIARWMLPGLWAIGALAAATVTPEKLAEIARSMGEKDGTIFAMPYFLGLILPSGLMGILVAAMLAADMSTDSSYMLTWGSVIYNDVLGPFRRRRLSERAFSGTVSSSPESACFCCSGAYGTSWRATSGLTSSLPAPSTWPPCRSCSSRAATGAARTIGVPSPPSSSAPPCRSWVWPSTSSSRCRSWMPRGRRSSRTASPRPSAGKPSTSAMPG
jgi:SSS family solute:Na+ symporter